jgi:hypothetical protein
VRRHPKQRTRTIHETGPVEPTAYDGKLRAGGGTAVVARPHAAAVAGDARFDPSSRPDRTL